MPPEQYEPTGHGHATTPAPLDDCDVMAKVYSVAPLLLMKLTRALARVVMQQSWRGMMLKDATSVFTGTDSEGEESLEVGLLPHHVLVRPSTAAELQQPPGE